MTELMYPKIVVPNIAANDGNEPIHDNWTFVNGPLMSGVSSDSNNGSAGDTHPTIVPWSNIIKPAIEWNFKNIFEFLLCSGKLTNECS